MSKTTVAAPANIAFVKYWGARDLEKALPMNPSISMTLDHCVTRCTVACESCGAAATVVADGVAQAVSRAKAGRMKRRMRVLA